MFWRMLLGTIATAEQEWIAVVVVVPLHTGTLGCTQGGLGSACPGLAGTQSVGSNRLGVEWLGDSGGDTVSPAIPVASIRC